MSKTVDEILAEIETLDPKERKRVRQYFIYRGAVRHSKTGKYVVHKIPSHTSIASVRFPGILKTPNVCGGSARIIRTRIPVWTLERMRQLSISESDILKSYPSLKAVDLVQAWGYAEAHAEEIAQLIRENEED